MVGEVSIASPLVPPFARARSCRDLLFPHHHFEMSHEGLPPLPPSVPPSLSPGSGGVRGELFSAAQLYKAEERAR